MNVVRWIDIVLRFIYVALVPIILAAMSMLMSVTALVVTAALATVIALLGTEGWRKHTGRVPLIGRFLGNMARLGEYYQEHRPKLLVYYVFYPLLFPYWLLWRNPRREFLLYKRLSTLVLVLSIAAAAYAYLTKWYPDIPFSRFAGSMVGLLILQLLITFSVIMPIVTTVVLYHQRGLHKTMAAVLVLGVLTGGPVWYQFHHAPPWALVALETRIRIKARSHKHPERAKEVLNRALDAGIATFLATYDNDQVLDRVRDELRTFYLADEARAFMVWHDAKQTQIMLMARPETSSPAYAWVARGKAGPIEDPAQLVPELRAAAGL